MNTIKFNINGIETEIKTDKIDFIKAFNIEGYNFTIITTLTDDKYFNNNLFSIHTLESNILTRICLTSGMILEMSVEEYWKEMEKIIDHEIERYGYFQRAKEALTKMKERNSQ